MTDAEKRIADAYAAICDALPPTMRADAREHWLSAIREFAAACLDAVAPALDPIECERHQGLADLIRSWT